MATPEQIPCRRGRGGESPCCGVRWLRAPRAALAPCGVGLLVLLACAAGCHPDHASFCASFSSGAGTGTDGTFVVVTDGDIDCRVHHHAVAIEAEGEGRFDGHEAGLDDGFAAGRSEGFTTGVLDARDGMVQNPAIPACCLSPQPLREPPPGTLDDDGIERSRIHDDAYRRGYREAWDEAFEEAFAEGYAGGYDEGYRFDAR